MQNYERTFSFSKIFCNLPSKLFLVKKNHTSELILGNFLLELGYNWSLASTTAEEDLWNKDMWVNFFLATVLIWIGKKNEMKRHIYSLAARCFWIDQLAPGQRTIRHRSFVCSVRKRIARLSGAAVSSSFWELGCRQYFRSSHSTWDVLWFRSNHPPSELLVFKSISNCSTRIAPAL